MTPADALIIALAISAGLATFFLLVLAASILPHLVLYHLLVRQVDLFIDRKLGIIAEIDDAEASAQDEEDEQNDADIIP
jgi:hypothetical protein